MRQHQNAILTYDIKCNPLHTFPLLVFHDSVLLSCSMKIFLQGRSATNAFISHVLNLQHIYWICSCVTFHLFSPLPTSRCTISLEGNLNFLSILTEHSLNETSCNLVGGRGISWMTAGNIIGGKASDCHFILATDLENKDMFLNQYWFKSLD